MRSTLDKVRKLSFLTELDSEKVIHASTGSFDAGRGRISVWKLGAVYLTDSGLSFVQGKRIIFKLPISHIKEIKIVERLWVMNKRLKQLEIRYINPIMNKGRIYYFAVQNAKEWEKKLTIKLI
jgi:hypothetical protein